MTKSVLYVLALRCYIVYMNAPEKRHLAIQQEDAQLWQAEVFGGLEVFRASLAEFHFSPHSHEEFMIALTEAGSASPRFWGGVQQIVRGDLFVLNPGVVHAGGAAQQSIWRYRAFYPPAALMQRVAQELTGADRGIPQFAEGMIRDPYVTTLLGQAHRALEEPESALGRESLLLEALAGLIARHDTGRPSAHRIGVEHRAVKLAKEVLEALPGENVSLDMLARESGLSAFHLCRVFRRAIGLSPHSYQILVRVRFAKTLLAEELPISQVAVEAGFYDQAHLTKHFKRIFGVTPGRYLY